MKKYLILFTAFLLSLLSMKAQNNVVELGLIGFVNRNVNLSYEYKLSDKFSAKCDLGYLLKGKLLYLDIAEEFMGDDESEGYLEIALNRLKLSAFSIHPQIRFFPSGKALNGLYLGPYAKYADYKFTSNYTTDVTYEDGGVIQQKDNVVFDLTGHVRKLGAGLMIGYQWIISESVSLDWCFFGPGLAYTFATSVVDAPDFPTSRNIGEFTEDELSNIPEIFGKIDVEQLSPTRAKGTWNSFIPIYRFNLSIGIAF